MVDARNMLTADDEKGICEEYRKIHAVVSSMADGVLFVDRERRVVLWNQAALKMLALDNEPEPGKDVKTVIPIKALIQIIEKGFVPESSHAVLSEEVELPPPANRTLLVNVSTVRDESGQDFGVVITFWDITDLKEMNRVKSRFVAMVTHELRSPLSAIEGYLSAYLTEAIGSDPQMYRQMMERARQRTHSLLELVNDLLQYSRLEVKSAARGKEPLNISDIILNTVELLKIQGVPKDIAFEVDVPESLPLIEADPAEMEQLLTNLVSNAIKYNVKNGKVTVTARADSKFLHIVVADTGIGIDTDVLPCIFDEFFRACGPETRYITGTGLGLSIVKKIVESHAGGITVDSAKGRGTTFTVKLPIQQKKELE